MKTQEEIKAMAEAKFIINENDNKSTKIITQCMRDAFIAGYHAGRDESGWINVKDKLPNSIHGQFGEDENVLVLYHNHVYIGRFVNLGNGKYHWGISHISSSNSLEVTHWQPLPKPVQP